MFFNSRLATWRCRQGVMATSRKYLSMFLRTSCKDWNSWLEVVCLFKVCSSDWQFISILSVYLECSKVFCSILTGKSVCAQILKRLEEFKLFFPYSTEVEEPPPVSFRSPYNVVLDVERGIAYRAVGPGDEPHLVEVEVTPLKPYKYRQYDLSLIGKYKIVL